MFNQHAKWLKVASGIPWRRPVPSLNYLLSSHVWRQDNNRFSHQDPGFIDHVINKKAEVVRVYLPPDGNCLLSVADHCLRSRHYVNVIVAGKQPALDFLTMNEAIAHCTRGIGIWDWASSDAGSEPDVVLACAGDVPTRARTDAAPRARRSQTTAAHESDHRSHRTTRRQAARPDRPGPRSEMIAPRPGIHPDLPALIALPLGARESTHAARRDQTRSKTALPGSEAHHATARRSVPAA
jgi:D-xylulose 5-phosphate/D-fructose 6-phosphate phosphoketolase/XFP C-terminal domain